MVHLFLFLLSLIINNIFYISYLYTSLAIYVYTINYLNVYKTYIEISYYYTFNISFSFTKLTIILQRV